jgi:serine/threonine protein kinase
MCDYADEVAGLPKQEIHPEYSSSLANEIQSAAAGMRATDLESFTTSEAMLQRIRSIGIGGFGQVFEYKDLRFNRSVAVKVLQDRWVRQEDVVKRFLREMELTAEIDHPGCPAVYGSGKTNDGRDFFWMQFGLLAIRSAM